MKVLDKSKLSYNESNLINFFSNNTVYWFAIIVFILSIGIISFNGYNLYILKKDLTQYDNFISQDLPKLQNTLRQEQTISIWANNPLNKIIYINQSQPSNIIIYKAIKEIFDINNITITNISRQKNKLQIEGSIKNPKSYSITAVAKATESLTKYGIFKNPNISNISKETSDSISKSDFKLDIELKPYTSNFKTTPTDKNTWSIDITDNYNNTPIKELKSNTYKTHDKYYINLNWDKVSDTDVEYYLIYAGTTSQDMKLYDITKNNQYTYETFDNKKIVLQIFTVDKNLNKSKGSNFTEIDTQNIEPYNQISNITIFKNTLQINGGGILSVFNISWKEPTNNKRCIIMYSIDNQHYNFLGDTYNNIFEFSTYDIQNKYYFIVLNQK